MKYYLGIDCSTSCTGLAIIDEEGKLIYNNYVYTKKEYQKAGSLGDAYTVLYNAYETEIKKMAHELYEKDSQAHFNIAIECNTVNKGKFLGGVDTTMKLSIAIGVIHAVCLKNMTVENIYYSAANNWRAGILCTSPQTERALLKIGIMNWAEKTFNIKLPTFVAKSDGIKVGNMYDVRVNDVSDAIGLAYCCKNKLLDDRRTHKIEQRVVDNLTHSLKNHFKFYRDKIENWKKEYKNNPSKLNKETLLSHIESLEKYYNSMLEKMVNNSIHDKYYKKVVELRKELECQ